MAVPLERLIEQVYAARREDRFAEARDLARGAVALGRDLGAPALLARSLMALGQVERDLGQSGLAQPRYQEAIALLRQQDDGLVLAHAVRHLGDLHQELGDLAQTEACYDEALAVYRRLPEVPPLVLANALRPLAILKDQMGETADGRRLWEKAKALYERAEVQAGVDECAARLAGRPAADS